MNQEVLRVEARMSIWASCLRRLGDFCSRAQVLAAEDLVEDHVGGLLFFGEGTGDDGFGLIPEGAKGRDEFRHLGIDEETFEGPRRWVVRVKGEYIHKAGGLFEEQDVVEAVLDRAVKSWVEIR